MKLKSIFLSGTIVSIFLSPDFSKAANFSVSDGDWIDGTSWNIGDYPGSTTSEDHNAIISTVSGGETIANLAGSLDTALASFRVDGQTVGEETIVNIDAGSNAVVANETTNALMVINEAGGGDGDATVNLIGGTLDVNQLRMARDGGVAQFNLFGGTFTHNGSGGGRQIAMRADNGNLASAIVNVEGGELVSTATGGQWIMATFDSQIVVRSGRLSMAGLVDMTTTGSALIEVHGDAATEVKWATVQGTATGTFSFVANSTGVTPVTVTKTLNLDTGATLRVNLDDYQSNADLVLFDYTGASLGGDLMAFSNIEITGGTGSIEMAGGNGSQIVLTDISINAGRRFEVTKISTDPETGQPTITWSSLDAVPYWIYQSTDLKTWIELEDNVMGTGLETVYTDTLSEVVSQRFYIVSKIALEE